jgi:hypothetical protein
MPEWKQFNSTPEIYNTIIPADCQHIACLITQASYWIMTHTGTLKLNAFLGASSLARSCYTKKATDTSVMRDPTNLGDIPKRFRFSNYIQAQRKLDSAIVFGSTDQGHFATDGKLL